MQHITFHCKGKACIRLAGEQGILHKVANKLRRNRNVQSGITVLMHGYRMGFKDARIATELGNCFISTENFRAAGKYLQLALRLDPDNTVAINSMGRLYLAQRQYGLASKWYNRSLATDAEDPVPYISLGKISLEKGRYNQARSFFFKALKFDPENIGAHLLIGSSYQEQGKTDKAERWYQEVLRINPQHSRVLYKLSRLMLELGKRKKAIGYLERVLDNEYHYRALLDLAEIRPQNARKYFDVYKERLIEWQKESIGKLL